MTLLTNQVQSTGAEDAAGEFLQEEAVSKDMSGEEDASTAQNKHH